jgi:probable F420-dependent oxidoreductase
MPPLGGSSCGAGWVRWGPVSSTIVSVVSLKFGVGLPSCREGTAYAPGFVEPGLFSTIARRAEALGFHSLWANDHLSTPRIMRGYLDQPPNFYEPLVTYASLANITEQLRFVLSVIVLPNRDPVLLAKQIATLDVLTGGRVLLGVGVGSDRDEFESIQPGLKGANRGTLVEERVQALRHLFSERRVSFEGAYVQLRDVEIAPKPVQQPFPVYLSAREPSGLRRAGRLADGLVVAALAPSEIPQARAHMADGAREVARDPSTLTLHFQINLSFGRDQQAAEDRLMRSATFQRLVAKDPDHSRAVALQRFKTGGLVGSPDQVVQQLKAYEQAGLAHMGIIFMSDTPAELLTDMESFARQVMPAFEPLAV